MKKLVLLFGLVVALFITITQPTQLLALDEQQTTTQQIDVDQLSETDVERVIDKYTGKIGVFFENLANDLTPVAEATYKSYVRYLWAVTGSYLSVSLIVLIISIILIIKSIKWIRNAKSINEPPLIIVCVITSFAALISFIVLMVNMVDAIKLAVSPEIVVAKEVLELL